ncbi:MAG: peptidoglycan DD-metalloendopeptidase family protein [Bacteroidales bacterium]
MKSPYHRSYIALLLCLTLAASQSSPAKNPYFTLEIPFHKTDSCQTEPGQQSPYIGKVISPFGKRNGRNHTGTDIKLHKGDSVRAALAGRVTRSGNYYGYGLMVVLKHPNNVETSYAHLSKCLVDVGDSIPCGFVVGLGGRTGRATTEHLHFEVHKNKRAVNPEDYFDFASGQVLTALHTEDNPSQLLPVGTEPTYIVVKKGDTLFALAKRHGTTVQTLRTLNQLNSDRLSIGDRLRIS